MKSFFLLIFVCGTLLPLVLTLGSSKKGCGSKDVKRIDLIAERLQTIGPNGRNVPENFSQLKTFCKETKEMTETIYDFVIKCFTGETLNYAKLAIFVTRSQIKTYCGKRTKKLSKLIKAGSCVNKFFIKDDHCVRRFMNQTYSLFDIPDNLKIPYSCCYTFEGLDCGEKLVEKYSCGRKHRDVIMDFLRSGMTSFTNIVCGEYTEDGDRCEKLKKLKEVKPKSNYRSPLFLMIELLSSFESGEPPRID